MRRRDGDSHREGWEARWRDPDGRQRRKKFRTKAPAERFISALETSKAAGAYVDPSAGRRTVGDYGTLWLERQGHLKAKSASSQRSLWRSQVEPRWGTTRLDAVTYGDVQAWVRTMGAVAELSPSRARQCYHLLTSILGAAVKDGLLAANRAAGVPLPKLSPSRRRYLTHGELAGFAAAAGPHGLFVLTLGYSGLRWGEAAELRVGDFDPLRARLTVVHSVSDVDGVLIVQDAKDHERRSVPLPRSLAGDLAGHVAGRARDALVFPAARGGHMRSASTRRGWWDRAAVEAGLGGVTPHELRHTAASLAVQAGASVLAVCRMLGHAKPSMTLDTYADLFDSDLDDVAERLDAARRGVSQVCPKPVVADLAERRKGL